MLSSPLPHPPAPAVAPQRRDRELALQLLRADLAQTKAEVKAKKRAVMQQLWQLPDFSTQVGVGNTAWAARSASHRPPQHVQGVECRGRA